jgi:hypothetical protein
MMMPCLWKDEGEFQDGVQVGGIRPEWVQQIEQAKAEIFERINKRMYPLDASWQNWQPDPAWMPPRLPRNWDEVGF